MRTKGLPIVRVGRVQTLVWMWLAVLLCYPGSALEAGQRNRSKGARPARLSVAWAPLSILTGAPFLFRVSASQPLRSLTGTWLGKELVFEVDGVNRQWFALSGVALDVTPGRYQLVLSGETALGVKSSGRQSLTVKRANYGSSALSVPRQYTEPDASTAARIAQDQALKRAVFSILSPRRYWAGAFVTPIKSVTTEPFGTRRTFNGQVQSVHHGIDLRAEVGTPIQAMNAGTVVLARELFFEGNCVVIDHGQGLLTLYLHLSEVEVKEGDRVHKAQTVGLSGATGRVTAPHLHAAVRWKGIYLDPARLLKLSLPD